MAVTDMDAKPKNNIPTVKLSNGVEMPQLNLGMAFWNVEKGKIEHHPKFLGFLPEQTYKSLHMALEAGIFGIDTALIYRSHTMIRQVLGEWFMKGKINRSDIFLLTKVFHHSHPFFATKGTDMPPNLDEMTPQEVTAYVTTQVEACFTDLGLGYIDCMLLHWPAGANSQSDGNRARRLAAWKVLQDYYEKGWLRSIGVSNFSEIHLQQLKEDCPTDGPHSVQPMVNQIEASVYLQWDKIREYCQANNIQVEAFSPLGHGAASVISDPVVKKIADKYGKDGGQVAMRYLIQKGYAVTFASSSAKRLRTNQQLFDFDMNEDEMKALDALNGTADSTGQPSPYDMK